jgi:glycerol-3-phosphate dehydrogenase (NAD(P)+)
MSRLVVMGAGAWGKALAQMAERAGHAVKLWSRRAPDAAAVMQAEALIISVPAQDVRQVLGMVTLPDDVPLIITAKGIERSTGKFMHEVVEDCAPHHPALILSGPSFAADVLAGLPTAVTLAGPDLDLAMRWANALSIATFRIYGSDDVKGVAIGGAMKNVLAIACGICDGVRLGDSARAALITRGFAELSRFGAALGARPETMMGLSGMGDLILTASSEKSRNYAFGKRLGEGMGVAEAVALSSGTVEGAYTASVAVKLAQGLGIAMPIVSAVHAIVDLGSSPREEIARLLARPVTTEKT